MEEIWFKSNFILPDDMKEVIEIYENIVFDLACLFSSDLGISRDPIKIAETFYYMQKNKYLSAHSFFKEDIPTSFETLEEIDCVHIDVMGSIILTGYGVCRHKADFLNHLFNELGYLSSQLFIYYPDLSFAIKNNSNRSLSNYEAQEYYDRALEDLDVFSSHDISFEKQYGDISVGVDYHPSLFPNHTINIVKKLESDTICILDVSEHQVAESVGDRRIRMADIDNPGLVYNYYVQNYPDYKTYYPPRYGLGFSLFQNYDTDTLETSLRRSLLYCERVNEYVPEFENFRNKHEAMYQQVESNYNKLIKRYSTKY